ncbi:hypothetical protein LDC_0797 [sediment metagenome]|uniref:Uncharacterized protein n=1 Tax=sediment metagenome TaxID=749907 RepID=D9PH00_9ZZZZ
MGKSKEKTGSPALNPEEHKLLDGLLAELSRLDPCLLAERIPGPQVAAALAEKLPADDPAAPGILLGLRSLFHEKAVQKAIKKAAFRLRQKGILLPEQEDAAAPVLKSGKAAESDPTAYLGPIDGTGSRPVFICAPQRTGGVGVAVGVVNDAQGVIEFAFTRHSKKRMKEIKELFFSKLPGMVETALSHAADVLERAYQAGKPEVSDSARAYLQFRPWLLERSSRMQRPAIHDFLSFDATSSGPLTEAQVQRLLGHGLMASWVMDLKSLRPLIEEIRRAEESRIFISEGQRLEHIQRKIHESLSNLFSEDHRQALRYRLEEMAYVFFKSGEEGPARGCLAVASSLSEKDSPLRANPFLRILVERSLTHYLKSSKKFENTPDQKTQRLIIT